MWLLLGAWRWNNSTDWKLKEEPFRVGQCSRWYWYFCCTPMGHLQSHHLPLGTLRGWQSCGSSLSLGIASAWPQCTLILIFHLGTCQEFAAGKCSLQKGCGCPFPHCNCGIHPCAHTVQKYSLPLLESYSKWLWSTVAFVTLPELGLFSGLDRIFPSAHLVMLFTTSL